MYRGYWLSVFTQRKMLSPASFFVINFIHSIKTTRDIVYICYNIYKNKVGYIHNIEENTTINENGTT